MFRITPLLRMRRLCIVLTVLATAAHDSTLGTPGTTSPTHLMDAMAKASKPTSTNKMISDRVLRATGNKKPHIVLLVIDDVGWADVGFHGSDFPTPTIDRLATSQGVRLEKYYVQQVCSPTRAALQTGRLPHRIGTQWVQTIPPGSPAALPKDVPTIAEMLSNSTYRTHAIGKWHLGYARWENTPLGRGYESYVGYLQGAVDYYNKTIGLSTVKPAPPKNLGTSNSGATHSGGIKLTGYDFWVNKTAAWDKYGRYDMDDHEDEARRVVANHDPSEPLFLYYAPQNIHEPLEMPPEDIYSENCAKVQDSPQGPGRHVLCTMMNRLDKAVANLEEMLKAKSMWDNTVLWVTTDNGGMLPHGIRDGVAGSASSNTPLRAGKGTLFEGGVRGISFVTGGYLPVDAHGTSVTGLLQHVDVTATLAALAGTAILHGDGFDVWDVVSKGASSPRTEVVLNLDKSALTKAFNLANNQCCGGFGEFDAIIQGPWKLIKGNSGLYDGWNSNDPYTITPPNASQTFAEVSGDKVWLFNLEVDPEERSNVALAHPDVTERMLASIVQHMSEASGYISPGYNLPLPRSFPNLHNGTWAPFLKDEEHIDSPKQGGQIDTALMHSWALL